MAKINNNQFKNIFDYWTGSNTDPITATGTPLNLYEFEIVSGFINITERGESNLKTITEKETTSIMLQTNNEPMVVYWVDSFKATLNDEAVVSDNGTIYPAKQSSTKNYKVGKYYKAYIQGQPNVSFDMNNVDINGDIYNTLEKNISVNLYVEGTDFNTTNFNKKLFLVLDPRVRAYQWLKVNSCTPVYDETLPSNEEGIKKAKHEIVGSYLTLTNLNLLFSTNGRNILSFIQLTHPGGNYVFPKEDIDGNVSIDTTYTQLVRGVRNIQLEADAGVAINSITVYGRQRDNKYITSPKRLLMYLPKLPQLSSLDYTPAGINNYYAFWNCKNVMEGYWNSWKEKVESLYNYDNEKKFRGGLQVDFDEARKSNEQLNGFYSGNVFSNKWTFKVSPTTNVVYNLKENYLTTDEWNFLGLPDIDLADFLNFNGFLYQTLEELPTDYKETIKWNLKSIPVLGNVLNLLYTPFRVIMGFDPGWTTSNSWITSKPINLLIPTTTAEMADTIMGKSSLIPYEVFTNDNSTFTASGNKMLNTCLHFSLTDRFQSSDTELIIAGAPEGKGGNGIWDTKYLGQTVDENGNSLGIPNTEPFYGKLLFTPKCKKIAPLDPMQEYEIDFINYKVYGSADMRLSFFTNDSVDNNDTRHISVYEMRHQNLAKFKDDPTLWSNSFVLNFMTAFNSDNAFEYPTTGILPSPEQKIEIPEARGQQVKYSYISYTNGTNEIPLISLEQNTAETNNLWVAEMTKEQYPDAFKLGQDLGYLGFYFWDPSRKNINDTLNTLSFNLEYWINDWTEITLPAGTEIDESFTAQIDFRAKHNKIEQNVFSFSGYSKLTLQSGGKGIYYSEINLYDCVPDMGIFTNTWLIGYPEVKGNNNWYGNDTYVFQGDNKDKLIEQFHTNFVADGYCQYPNLYWETESSVLKYNGSVNLALFMDIVNPKLRVYFQKIEGKWKYRISGKGGQRFGLLNFPIARDAAQFPFTRELAYEYHSIRRTNDVENKDTAWKKRGNGENMKQNIEINSEIYINSLILKK